MEYYASILKESPFSTIFMIFFIALPILLGIVPALVSRNLTKKQTYSQKPENMEYSSLSRRFCAAMIDLFIILTFICFGKVVLNLLGLAYILLMQSSKYQATIGMQVMGIKLYTSDFKQVPLQYVFLRYLSTSLSFILLAAGYFMAIFTKRKQTLHDIVTKTVVCKEK